MFSLCGGIDRHFDIRRSHNRISMAIILVDKLVADPIKWPQRIDRSHVPYEKIRSPTVKDSASACANKIASS